MSSSSLSYVNTSQTNNCEWTISVTNCYGQEYFQVVYGVTTYLSLFVLLSSVWLLLWRLYRSQSMTLFSIKGFLSLEGYLFTQIFWSFARVFSSLILINNWFPEQWILREIVIDLTWFLGLVSVATYLAGVLRTIPRMNFYRQNTHYKHLPNFRGIASIYVSYVLVLGIISIICAVMIGYHRQYPTENSATIIKNLITVYYCTESISTLLITIGFIIYGNKLVGIASEGLHLLEGVSGYPSSPRKSSRYSHNTKRSAYSGISAELEVKHKKLQRSVRKMRVINAAFILSFAGLCVILCSSAFLYEQIFKNIEISKILAAVSNWMPMMLNVSVMAGIAYGEMRISENSELRFDNQKMPSVSTSSSTTPHFLTIERISSEAGSLYHSRNNSTDSEAPLLRRPAPVATISSRKGSAQLDSSPNNTTSSTYMVIGSSPLTTFTTLSILPPSDSTSNEEKISISVLP
ncbi:1393_t:CDS:2 [Funneliformis geosporum]|uniref:16261_t:CDS:1 n=1 Tax=Funneliformis geosporum TaxID=1117311 RepID=A0A9W4SZ76_9GLOM|nr:16261_t:CDS:2 [Funneliformis geosporum]CAI2187216.1 1393_t:CDS:2 [Funneliformis geosporum]